MKPFRTSAYSSLLGPHRAPAETQKLYVRSVGYSFADSDFHEKPRYKTYGSLYWCIQGSAAFQLDGTIHILNPGEIWFYPPGSLTDFQPQKEGMLYYWMAMHGEFLLQLFNSLDINPGKKYCGAPPDALWQQLIIEVLHASAHRRLNALRIAMDILFEIAAPKLPKSAAEKLPLAQRAKKIIEQEFCSYNFDINLLSTLLGVHPVTLCREFKKAFQVTPSEFLSAYRLQKALELLESRNYLVKEVAEMCGFSSPEYFTSTFHEKFGISPSKISKNPPATHPPGRS